MSGSLEHLFILNPRSNRCTSVLLNVHLGCRKEGNWFDIGPSVHMLVHTKKKCLMYRGGEIESNLYKRPKGVLLLCLFGRRPSFVGVLRLFWREQYWPNIATKMYDDHSIIFFSNKTCFKAIFSFDYLFSQLRHPRPQVLRLRRPPGLLRPPCRLQGVLREEAALPVRVRRGHGIRHRHAILNVQVRTGVRISIRPQTLFWANRKKNRPKIATAVVTWSCQK